MSILKRISKIVGPALIVILLFQVAYKGTSLIGKALAVAPDRVIVNIGGDNTASANLFNNDEDRYWYPGFSEQSSLGLVNTIGEKVQVDSFGMEVELVNGVGEESQLVSELQKEEFLNKMRIKLIKEEGELQTHLFEGTFKEFSEGPYTGPIILLDSGEVEDVVYTVSMDKDASQDISNLTAQIDFTFNVLEIESKDGGSGGTTVAGGTGGGEVPAEFALIEDETTPLGVFNKLFMGYPDGTMNAGRTLTRAELACVVYRALSMQPVTEWEIVFSDETQWWYEKEAKAVVGAGYMILQRDDSKHADQMTEIELNDLSYFNGDQIVSRQELADVLTRVFRMQLMSQTEGLSFAEYSQMYNLLMNESATITADMLRQIMLMSEDMSDDFVAQVEAQKLAFGQDNSMISMNMPVTRLEVAKIFYRMLYMNTAPVEAEQTDTEESSDL